MNEKVPSYLVIDDEDFDSNAAQFCAKFIEGSELKYILGTNEYARSIASLVDIDGFVDDFSSSEEFLGKPVVRTEYLPPEALVVSAVVGVRPLTVDRRLKKMGIACIDYFSFARYSGLPILDIPFIAGFERDFVEHRERYEALFSRLADDASKLILSKLINFRLSSSLRYMDGFEDAQYRQYFEDFLSLKESGETFVDVGSYDGYTSLEFVRRCPSYESIHIFEPEPKNMEVVRERLGGLPRIKYHPFGLSDCRQTLRFKGEGSASHVSIDGHLKIEVAQLDDLVDEPVSFVKMDIEGGEPYAIGGAKRTIMESHPRLAISVYHRADDLRRIPEKVLGYREDYDVFLRHYTEGVTETVMFFLPAS